MSKQSNLIAGLRANPVMGVLVGVFIVASLSGVLSFFRVQSASSENQGYLGLASDLRTNAFRVTDLTRQTMEGDTYSFDQLNTVLEDMDSFWADLGGPKSRLSQALPKEMSAFKEILDRVKLNSETIIKNKDSIILMHDVAGRLNQTIPDLQREYDNVVDMLLQNGAPADQVAQARMQSWRAERIARNVEKMLAGGPDAKDASEQFKYDANMFGKVVQAMKEGNAQLGVSRVTDAQARKSLDEVTGLFKFLNESANDIVKSTDPLFTSRQAAENILADTPNMQEALNNIAEQVGSGLQSQNNFRRFFYFCAGVSLLSLVIIGILQVRGGTRRLQTQQQENDRNQEAILRLLDELADLADGDLTATATVTEDFTGAIADSINFTIDQLRVLVSRINDTAMRVSAAAQETQSTAIHLAEASDHQAQEIAGASAAINEMAVTIDQVSANAAESAAVAERSVSIANKGAEVVQNTIQGMDNIREQIQETSKRIKRLGESSQEIGDIVSLINDIADQTNILALNAAIQASMAGDAGRGFAVVADEVQRLAERSSAATKQIEALVKTIQTDTNEAVASMEQTTAEVVRGARLAQDAGVALEEIENVSTTLAELIQNISNAARQQASSAGHISNTMNVIQEITSQTSSGTNTTARAIGHLAEMAVDLRDSVQGFKLPEEASSYSQTGMSSHADAMMEDDRLSL